MCAKLLQDTRRIVTIKGTRQVFCMVIGTNETANILGNAH
jgi:hypothetical protein